MTQVPPTAEAALCSAQGLVQNAPDLLGEPDPVQLESYLHPTPHPNTEFTILLHWVVPVLFSQNFLQGELEPSLNQAKGVE